MILIGSFIYVGGICIYISTKTTFLDKKSITYLNRDITPRDVRMSLLWPLLCIFWIIKNCIWVLNDLCNIVLIGFGYCNYKKSRFYNFINRKFRNQ